MLSKRAACGVGRVLGAGDSKGNAMRTFLLATSGNPSRRLAMALQLCCLLLPATLRGLQAQSKPEPMALTPSEVKWESQGGLALGGIEQAKLVGDPTKPGPYTIRLKFPAGYKLAPHTHPDYREVTILSGTWYMGYGEKFDEGALKALPAGRFYTEHANLPHFVAVREPVLIQVSGTGPSGRVFVDVANKQK